MDDAMRKLYERAVKNCQFYEKEGKVLSLMNEIGFLRGIITVIEETTGKVIINDDTIHFIHIQQTIKEKERNLE